MSADLLAEFDSFYQTPAPVPKPTLSRFPETSGHFRENTPKSIGEGESYGDSIGNYDAWLTTGSSQHSDPQDSKQQISGQHVGHGSAEEMEDDWGDFETGQETDRQIQVQLPHESIDRGQRMDISGITKSSAVGQNTTPKTQDNSMFTLYPLPVTKVQNMDWEHPQTSNSKARANLTRKPRDENILFDAEEDRDDDDIFGNSEHVQDRPTTMTCNNSSRVQISNENPPSTLMDFDNMISAIPSTHQQADITVLRPTLTHGFSSFDDWTENIGQPGKAPQGLPLPETSNSPQHNKWEISHKPVNDSRSWHGNNALKTTDDNTSSQYQPRMMTPLNDTWDDFDTNVSTRHEQRQAFNNDADMISQRSAFSEQIDGNQTVKPARASISSTGSQIALPHNTVNAFSTTSNASAPPDNIPPPAMLLPLFASLFTLAQTQLFEHLGGRSTSSGTREAILTHPETQTFLVSYLAIAGVLARIIAGRKLRWKRDTLLAQNMRIGPASSSGRSSGMKLAGIDKVESAKEEREMADILRLWRIHLGRLRSAVASAGSGTIPELAENPAVRVAKESEGALAAPRACALCSLKRNERVAKVDLEVQDSFGEWWIEHWGHRTCKSFWEVQKVKLSSR